VIASSAASVDGAQNYLHGDPYAPHCDSVWSGRFVDVAERRGQKPHVGQVATVDVFYNPDGGLLLQMGDRGVLAFEMETSVLYYLAARARAARADVAAAHDPDRQRRALRGGTSRSLPSLDELNRSIERTIEIALEAGTSN